MDYYAEQLQGGEEKMNQRKIGIVLSYLNMASNILINFAYIPVLIFYIGKSEYGLYQLMGSVIGYFMLMDFGLSTTVSRFYIKYKILNDNLKKENLIAISLVVYGGISLLVALLGSVLYFYIEDIFSFSLGINEVNEAKNIYVLLLLNIVLTFFGYIFTAVIASHERFIFLKGTELIQTILKPIAVVTIIQISPYAVYVVLVQSILNVILLLIKIWYCFKKVKIKIKYHFWDKILLHDIIQLSSTVFVVAIVDQIFYQTNQVVLGILYGTEVVAVYSIAALVYSNYMTLSCAISGVLGIRATEIAITGTMKDISNLFIKYGRIQLIVLGFPLISFLTFGQLFIELWLGKVFIEAYWIGCIILIPMTIDLVQNVIFSVMQVRNQYGFRAKLYTIMAIANIVLAIPAAKIYGGIGCSFITGIILLIGNGFCLNIYFFKKMKLDVSEYWKQLSQIGIVLCIIASISIIFQNLFVIPSLFTFGIVAFFYGILYGILIWKFALNTYEKNMFMSMLKR